MMFAFASASALLAFAFGVSVAYTQDSGRSPTGRNGHIGSENTAWSYAERSKEGDDHVSLKLFTRYVADVATAAAARGRWGFLRRVMSHEQRIAGKRQTHASSGAIAPLKMLLWLAGVVGYLLPSCWPDRLKW